MDAPELSPARGLLYGSIGGVGLALAVFAKTEALLPELARVFQALICGEWVEFAAGIVLTVIYAGVAVTAGLLVAMPAAIPFILAMTALEWRVPLFRKAAVWALGGAVFAFPAGFWLSGLGISDHSEWLPGRNLWFLSLYLGSGAIGGLAAWCGYYDLIGQIRSRNSSSTAR